MHTHNTNKDVFLHNIVLGQMAQETSKNYIKSKVDIVQPQQTKHLSQIKLSSINLFNLKFCMSNLTITSCM